MRVWRLMSVAYIGPKSRTERPRKTKIGTEVAHVTRDSDTTFNVKGQGQGRGGIVWRAHYRQHSLLFLEEPISQCLYAVLKLSRNAPEWHSTSFLNVGTPFQHLLMIQLFWFLRAFVNCLKMHHFNLRLTTKNVAVRCDFPAPNTRRCVCSRGSALHWHNGDVLQSNITFFLFLQF